VLPLLSSRNKPPPLFHQFGLDHYIPGPSSGYRFRSSRRALEYPDPAPARTLEYPAPVVTLEYPAPVGTLEYPVPSGKHPYLFVLMCSFSCRKQNFLFL